MRRWFALAMVSVACSRPAPGPVAFAPDRDTFNVLAPELAIPLFQKRDGSFAVYRADVRWTGTVAEGRAAVSARFASGPPRDLDRDPTERTRRAKVRAELAAGRTTLIETDLTGLPAEEAAMVSRLMEAAGIVEALFAEQRGVAALRDRVPDDDPASRMLWFRNQGPWCLSPTMIGDPACAAIPGDVPRSSGLYPADIQTDGFCDTLPDDVLSPFTVVGRGAQGLVAVPYPERWPELSRRAAAALLAAAEAAPAREAELAAYLRAAADAFTTNDWFAADVAWAAMAGHSDWYVRVGPDEVYFDPCGVHAGFHMVLARIDPDGLATQAMLEPVKQDMEAAAAALAGPPYAAREVGFQLPEFIQIVLNAGDARRGLGATVGQSLPNWGPVADAGGRTVAMTNIGVDPDSVATQREVLASLLCDDTLTHWPAEPGPQLLSTVLHEAAHNLGPSHEYRVGGQTDTETFGGPLASMLEELKAQTAAMWFTGWLAERGLLDASDVHRHHIGDIAWGLGHVASGPVDAEGAPEAYGQLAIVQLGAFLEAGAVRWEASRVAANGEDTGCLTVDPAALPGAIDALAREVSRIKATGDVAAAEALVSAYIREDGELADMRRTIAERFERRAQPTYVYRVILPPTE